MNLLDKFATVDTSNVSAITEKDKAICEAEQKAYDNALELLTDTYHKLNEVKQQESELIGDINHVYNCKTYIWDGALYPTEIIHAVEIAHSRFVEALCDDFNHAYNGDFRCGPILDKLIPKTDYHKDWAPDTSQRQQYYDTVMGTHLRYETVVEEIMKQLNGYSLAEAGLVVIKREAWRAANAKTEDKDFVPAYSIKGNTLTFANNCQFCKREKDSNGAYWALARRMVMIGRALSEFETNGENTSRCSAVFSDDDVYEFTGHTKVMKYKFYGNGRVDVIFADAVCLNEFVEEYLKHKPL